MEEFPHRCLLYLTRPLHEGHPRALLQPLSQTAAAQVNPPLPMPNGPIISNALPLSQEPSHRAPASGSQNGLDRDPQIDARILLD